MRDQKEQEEQEQFKKENKCVDSDLQLEDVTGVFDRNIKFLESRNQKLKEKMNEVTSQETKELTFTPRINKPKEKENKSKTRTSIDLSQENSRDRDTITDNVFNKLYENRKIVGTLKDKIIVKLNNFSNNNSNSNHKDLKENINLINTTQKNKSNLGKNKTTNDLDSKTPQPKSKPKSSSIVQKLIESSKNLQTHSQSSDNTNDNGDNSSMTPMTSQNRK
mmetsp:Transcript_41159/g.89786  ORF Transcript_41159/g.89786 Transcript_41159/m.89786 type:complete len:220 (+) Transcript_41159:454-1113(+)|eukprot:CAMPEP_0116894398 /NCGR_PEP_ID=MMETSP0467-20121206/4175_1 /TAXON_ID=283647 /ORGANISM="Mesodinium pulex, Strain SPMC105" /LENGTH=219 /DNA_ID=CAMNT_0004564595 /DNA_START=550 /DNA_END=1209 /DNA_ORIENTATION=+